METTLWRTVLLTVIGLAGVGCNRDPFPYDQVSGTVRYSDGAPIPCERLVVTLIPQVEAIDQKTHPRPGMAVVRPDGAFDVVSTLNHGDGATRGRHKVTVVALGENEMPSDAVHAKYAREETTPLEFDTSQTPWVIAIDRPNE